MAARSDVSNVDVGNYLSSYLFEKKRNTQGSYFDLEDAMLRRMKGSSSSSSSSSSEKSDIIDTPTSPKEKTEVVEYNPVEYDDLDVDEDIKQLFQYITKYTPQTLQLDNKFKPFIPEFIPAVGDVDAFLKVQPPETTLSNEKFEPGKLRLGLTVLDEPATNQSDPALLQLQLRASSVNVVQTRNMVVKKVDNVERNAKIVDKWIKDVSDLHKTKSSPVVKYTDSFPSLDDLLQAWPEPIETLLKTTGFPNHKFSGPLSTYTDYICCIFDIPVYKNRIQSVHLLFSLYAIVKNSQLTNKPPQTAENQEETNQLVLD